MDMKKILQAFDGATTKPRAPGANDMKKFLSIVNENANPYTPVEERVITGFEEGSVGGDANSFLLSADRINDLVMSEIDKVKINADEHLLKELMSKFNAFMTAYHAVGKEILQPDLFDDTMGESVLKDKEDLEAKRKALQDIQMDPNTSDDPELKAELAFRKAALEKEAKAKGFAESIDEATFGRGDAYDRDYQSSISGFGGGRGEVDDESNLMYIYKDGRLKQRMVDNHEERSAKAQGFRDSQKAALAVAGIIPSKFKPGKWVKKEGTKWVEVFPFGKPDAPAAQPKSESLSFTDYFNLVESKKGLE